MRASNRCLILLCLAGLPLLAPTLAFGAAPCKTGQAVRIWFSPQEPVAGQPLYLMATAAQALPDGATLSVNGKSIPTAAGVSWRAASLAAAAGERIRVEVMTPTGPLSCEERKLSRKPAPQRVQATTHWRAAKLWDEAHEAYYAAWLERLFAAPPEASLDFRPLAQALQDPRRNWLFNHLNLGEDKPGGRKAIKAAPDCADLPYVLRAYFAWKHELPFGFRECDRGSKERPPRCPTLHTNEEPTEAKDPVAAFVRFEHFLVNKVHSGALRTALDDDETDFYPVPLTRQALRPGTIFADPYGHVLVLASWIDQPAKPGLLFAVDGQPDASITRKRFWEGNFIFASDVASAGAGFKAFRPLHRAPDGEAAGALQAVTNKQLQRTTPQAHELAQARMHPEAFYARMFQLINPRGLDAVTAYDDTLAALVEQVEARARSVDNGEQYMRQTNQRVIEMPEGARIFETVGAWEDYATPSRDLRLLIAIKVLEALPARITAQPELFALGKQNPADVRKRLEARHAQLTRERKVGYTNSAGAPVELSVNDIVKRRKALEMAYNPNDCVEVRWGAPEGSAERSTCQRHAPAEQQARMLKHRSWFAEARRPARD